MDQLAAFENEARRLAADLRQVADWIESSASPDFLEKMETRQRQNKPTYEHKWKRYSEALNFPKAVEVVSLVTKTRKQVDELQRRLASSELE